MCSSDLFYYTASSPANQRWLWKTLCPGFLFLPLIGIFAEHLIKLLFQLSAFCRFLFRREHRGEVFQRDFPALKSHDFRFLFVSDSGTYKITFPFHAAASAVSVPPVYPAGYGQPAAVNCPVRFSALPVPSYLSSCLFHWLLPLLPAFHFPLTGH